MLCFCHVIALNPYRKGNKGKVFSNSMAVYDKVITSPEIRKMIQQIRGEQMCIRDRVRTLEK